MMALAFVVGAWLGPGLTDPIGALSRGLAGCSGFVALEAWLLVSRAADGVGPRRSPFMLAVPGQARRRGTYPFVTSPGTIRAGHCRACRVTG